MSVMHYIPTFPMWWLRRSGVVVCAKGASDLIFRLKLVSPDSFLLLQPQATLSAKCRTLLLPIAYRRYQAASLQAAKKSVTRRDDTRGKFPFSFSLVGESHSRRERSMHVGCGSKVSCTRAARRAITWARPRLSSLSGRTLPRKLGESCVPDKAPSRTAFYGLRGCTFYYLPVLVFDVRTDMHKTTPLRGVELVQAVGNKSSICLSWPANFRWSLFISTAAHAGAFTQYMKMSPARMMGRLA